MKFNKGDEEFERDVQQKIDLTIDYNSTYAWLVI